MGADSFEEVTKEEEMRNKKCLSACRAVIGAVIVASVFVGCSGGENKKKIKAKKASVEATSSQITSEYNAEKKLELQMLFFDELQALKSIWPESKEKIEFMKKYGAQAARIPNLVYTLSIPQKNFKAFKWATELLGKTDHNYHLFKDVSPEWGMYLVKNNPDCLEDARFYKSVITKAIEGKNIDGLKLIVNHWPKNKVFHASNNCIAFVFDHISDEVFLAKFVSLSTGKMSSATGLNCRPNVIKLLKNSEVFRDAVSQNPNWLIATYDFGSTTDDVEKQEVLFNAPKEVYEKIAESRSSAWYYNYIIPVFVRENFAQEKDFLRLMSVVEEKGWVTKGLWSFIFNGAEKNNISYALDYVFSNSDGKYTVFNLDLVDIARDQAMWDKYFPQVKEGKIYLSGRHDDGVTLAEVGELLSSTNGSAVFEATQHYTESLSDLGQYKEAVGRTMLMSVCTGGNLEAAKFLIEGKKVDINEKTDHQEGDVNWRRAAKEGSLTAVFYAASSGSCDLIQYLADNGASVKDRSYFKATPLMFAAENGQIEAVKLLLSLGADPNAKMAPPNDAFVGKSAAYAAEMGKSASAYNRAKKNGHKEIMQVLETAINN